MKLQDFFQIISDKCSDFIYEVKQGSPLHIAILGAASLLLVLLIVIIVMSALNGSSAESDTPPVAESIATSAPEDATYDKDANSISKSEFDGVVLSQTDDAGAEYIDETLFVGDSNTARMYLFGPVTLQNSLGASSMGIQHVVNQNACMYFSGYSSPISVVKSIGLLQPRRIYINYGTNNTGWDTETFINYYTQALDMVHSAYKYSDIVIVGVFPVAKIRTYTSITMQKIDDFNTALAALAKEKGYYYLDSKEALADATGYATASYMENDGIHLTKAGMAAYMEYVRTHALDTEDTRPALNSIPKHSQTTPDTVFGPVIAAPSSEASSSSSAAASSSSHVHTYEVAVITQPTCGVEGLQRYTCTVCAEQYDEVIPATGAHTYGEWIIDIPAQVGVAGSQHRQCAVCGAIETVVIPALKAPPVVTPPVDTPVDTPIDTPMASSSEPTVEVPRVDTPVASSDVAAPEPPPADVPVV